MLPTTYKQPEQWKTDGYVNTGEPKLGKTFAGDKATATLCSIEAKKQNKTL